MQPPSPEAPAGAALAADLAERAVLAVFFSAMSWSFLRSWLEAGGVASLILLVSEASVVVMVLARRRTSAVSLSPAEWLIAFLGTAAPLLARPVEGGAFLVTPLVCVPLMLAGFAIQIAAKFTLRRSFGVVAANRGVKVGGPYRIVRHPVCRLRADAGRLPDGQPDPLEPRRLRPRVRPPDQPDPGGGAHPRPRRRLPRLRRLGAVPARPGHLLSALNGAPAPRTAPAAPYSAGSTAGAPAARRAPESQR
jgi:hypothetical protein